MKLGLPINSETAKARIDLSAGNDLLIPNLERCSSRQSSYKSYIATSRIHLPTGAAKVALSLLHAGTKSSC